MCLTICLGSLERLLSASVRPVAEVTPAELLQRCTLTRHSAWTTRHDRSDDYSGWVLTLGELSPLLVSCGWLIGHADLGLDAPAARPDALTP